MHCAEWHCGGFEQSVRNEVRNHQQEPFRQNKQIKVLAHNRKKKCMGICFNLIRLL